MMDTEGEVRDFLNKLAIPCDNCNEITCDGFHDEYYENEDK